MEVDMKILKTFSVAILATAAMVAFTSRTASLLAAQQASKPGAASENAALRAFAEIQPIDAHIHIYFH